MPYDFRDNRTNYEKEKEDAGKASVRLFGRHSEKDVGAVL